MNAAECFGANLKRARRRAGLSQEEAALRAGVHRTEICLLEGGERKPRIDTLAKVCAGVEASPGELMEGIVWVCPDVRLGSFVISDSHRTFSKEAAGWAGEPST